ncbi:hypothetical protein JOM56_007278 [Amanita muscaria]
MLGQPVRRNVINVCADTESSFEINIKLVQGDKDVGVLSEFDITKCDVLALRKLGFIPWTDVLGARRGTKNVLAVLGVGNPPDLGTVKDGVGPCANVERESLFVNVGCCGAEAPAPRFIEVEGIEEDDDLGRCNEGTLKVDAHIAWGFGTNYEVALVLAAQDIQVGGSEVERIEDTAIDLGIEPSGNMINGGILLKILNRALDTDVPLVVDIQLTQAVRETRRGNIWMGEADCSGGVRLGVIPSTDGLRVSNEETVDMI